MNKQTALTIISIAGVTASVVVTAIMAPKADKAIKAKKEYIVADHHVDDKDLETDANGNIVNATLTTADKLELVKTAAPYYAPSALLLMLTVGSIILNHRINKKELLALSATASYLVASRDQIKKAIDKPEIKKLIKDLHPTKEMFKHQTIEETGNGDLLCIDGYSGRIFRSSEDAVIDAEEKLISEYLDPECGYCCLNDWYRFLNIEESQFGWDHGWANVEEEYYPNEPIEFSNELVAADAPGNDYGEPIFCIDIEEYWHPMEGWQEV